MNHPDVTNTLCQDFRTHLETFFHYLKLAPPYHSVEKAIAQLKATLSAMPAEQRNQLGSNPDHQWALYTQMFVEAGLPLKHRGIIAGLVRSQQISGIPQEYSGWLNTYLS